jgi:hypothetical protein
MIVRRVTTLDANGLQQWLRASYPRYRYWIRGGAVMVVGGPGDVGIVLKPLGYGTFNLEWTLPKTGARVLIVGLTMLSFGVGLVLLVVAWLVSRTATNKMKHEIAHVLRTGQPPPDGVVGPAFRALTMRDVVSAAMLYAGVAASLLAAAAYVVGSMSSGPDRRLAGRAIVVFLSAGAILLWRWRKRRLRDDAGAAPAALGNPGHAQGVAYTGYPVHAVHAAQRHVGYPGHAGYPGHVGSPGHVDPRAQPAPVPPPSAALPGAWQPPPGRR